MNFNKIFTVILFLVLSFISRGALSYGEAYPYDKSGQVSLKTELIKGDGDKEHYRNKFSIEFKIEAEAFGNKQGLFWIDNNNGNFNDFMMYIYNQEDIYLSKNYLSNGLVKWSISDFNLGSAKNLADYLSDKKEHVIKLTVDSYYLYDYNKLTPNEKEIINTYTLSIDNNISKKTIKYNSYGDTSLSTFEKDYEKQFRHDDISGLLKINGETDYLKMATQDIKSDIYDFRITDEKETQNNRHFLKDKKLSIEFKVKEDNALEFSAAQAGLPVINNVQIKKGEQFVRFNQKVDLSDLKLIINTPINDYVRYRLASIGSGTGDMGSASGLSFLTTSLKYPDTLPSKLNSFNLTEDTSIAFSYHEQYKIIVKSTSKLSDIDPRIDFGTSKQYQGEESWVSYIKNPGFTVGVAALKKVDGKLLQKIIFQGAELTPLNDDGVYKSHSLDPTKFNNKKYGKNEATLEFIYDVNSYTLKTTVEIPEKISGGSVFANKYANILNVPDGQTTSTITEKSGTAIRSDVKSLVFDPTNANIRYKLSKVEGTGSASGLSKTYHANDTNYNLDSFNLSANSEVKYTWTTQHRLIVNTSRSSAKALPVVLVNGESMSLLDSRTLIVNSSSNGKIVAPKENLAISFNFKGSEFFKDEQVLFSLGDTTDQHENIYLYYAQGSNELRLVQTKGDAWDKLASWVVTDAQKLLFADGKDHKLTISFKKESDTLVSYLKIDAESEVKSVEHDFLKKSFIATGISANLKGDLTVGSKGSFITRFSYSNYAGEITNLTLFDHTSANAQPYVIANRKVTATVAGGAGEYWVDDGANVKLLVPTSGIDNLIVQGFTITNGVSSAPKSPNTTSVTYNGQPYSQVALATSMSISDSGTANWDFGTKVHAFNAVIGQPFSLDKATASTLQITNVKTTEQVSDKVIKGIQGGYKPALLSPVENAPVNSTITNAMIYTSRDGANDATTLGRDLYKGQVYFTRPGLYRLEWLLGGSDFPIEGTEGISKLVAEVNVVWPSNIDYQHVAETPDVSLDVSSTDNLAFKELRLVQRYTKTITKVDGKEDVVTFVPDLKTDVQDITVNDKKQLSFPEWKDGSKEALYRSVLLFTRSRDANRAATGDLSEEDIVIKLVESKHWSNGVTDEAIEIGKEITNSVHDAKVPHNGFVLKKGLEKARYNTTTYNPVTLKGQIFAVNQELNSATTAKDGTDDLVVAWYKNHIDGEINWPNKAVRYSPTWPAKASVDRIVVASRLGSDGLKSKDIKSRQMKFDPARYENVSIYNQANAALAGYNPNEEHALIKPSYFYSETPRSPAAYALRSDLNQADNTKDKYSSEPFVLVQYQDKQTKAYGESKYLMKLYRIEMEDAETTDTHVSYKLDTNADGVINASDENSKGEFKYQFEYPMYAGDKVVAPYPLNEVIGASSVNEISGTNPVGKQVYWEDKDGNSWVIAGGGSYSGQFWYPMQGAFWHPLAKTGDIIPFTKTSKVDATVAAKSKYKSEDFVSDGNPNNYVDFTAAQNIKFNTFWKAGIPELRIGETLTFEGGEEKKDSPAAKGLPSAVGWASAEIVHDSLNASATAGDWTSSDKTSFRIHPAVREIKVDLNYFPKDVDTDNDGGKLFLKGLHAGLNQRVYYDESAKKLVLRGILNDRFAGDSQLTKSPGGYNYILQPNVLTKEDMTSFADAIKASTEKVGDDLKKDLLQAAFVRLYALALDPELTDSQLNGLTYDATTAIVKVGIKNSSGATVPTPVANTRGLSRFLRDKSNRLLIMTSADFAVEANIKALLPNGSYPKGVDKSKLELVSVDLNAPESTLPHGMTIEDSVSRNAIRTGGQLVRLVQGAGYVPASQLGTGLALMPNASLMKRVGEAGFSSHVVIAENNDPAITGSPIQLHIVKVNNRPYRGQIKTIFSKNVFDEKIALRHTGDFGGDANDLVFEWRYRETDATKPDTPPGPVKADPSCPATNKQPGSQSAEADWNVFADDRLPKPEINGQGRNELVFGKAAGKDVLVDNSFFVRYKHKDATNWSGWAGAGNNLPCNTPTAAYASQLVKGWVKRVTDNVNQYDARITDFSTDGVPATYVSMIEQAGAAYVGDIALNSDKDAIENAGLIALYETVLNRARNLSIDAAQASFTQGVGTALLNAASRISQFYTLLGNEAYSDSLDPTIGFSTGDKLSEYGSLSPTIFTFQNQVGSLAEEELALLRGRSELGGAPVHNRLLWNFTNNDGEAAYALSYDIKDKNADGSINEQDAKIMFPQGHGDAWGHYLSAVKGYYTLMGHKDFSWVPRSEKYEIDGVTLDVDYLDERRFAEAAAAKAKVGSEVVSLTYRNMYEEDPDGQWQGYKDTDATKSWGVDGWVRRVHQGAYFDWVVSHSMLPSSDTKNSGVQKIDRTTVPELQEISINGNQVLTQLAEINNGQNPLGLLPDVVPFDIEPGTDQTQFEQVYARAEKALTNAKNVFDYANDLKNRIRKVADTQQEFSEQVYGQDREYRNRLIELFGTPYAGIVGAGKAYPEGYDGPDIKYYQYIDVAEISEKTLPKQNATLKAYPKKFGSEYWMVTKKEDGVDLTTVALFKRFYPGDYPAGFSGSIEAPGPEVNEYPLSTGSYSFSAPSYWGKRSSPGALQSALIDIVKADVDVRLASKAYQGLIDDLRRIERMIKSKTKLRDSNIEVLNSKSLGVAALSTTLIALGQAKSGLEHAEAALKEITDATTESMPKAVGLSNDVTAPLRGAAKFAKAAGSAGMGALKIIVDVASTTAETAKELNEIKGEIKAVSAEYADEIQQQMLEIDGLLDSEPEYRLALFKARETLRQSTNKYRSTLGKGMRLLEERQAFNKKVAAKTHGKRYQDMAFRLNRTEASQKYRAAFDLAAKYAYLAAKAYDYETNLSPKHSASAQHVLKEIVQARTLGQVEDGEPVVGQGGLADTLARLKANFSVLKTQMGFNNPQLATEPFSMRSENFRVKDDKKKWQKALGKHYTANIWDIPEFRTQMRSFAAESSGKQPGLVIPFSTEITSGKNFFGFPLAANDHAYDPSQFSTRIQSVGIWLEGYKDLGLAETARAYLVPVGQDVMYVPDSVDLDTREWNVRDQKIPAPLPFGKSDMENASWMPMQAMDGPEGQVRRHSQLRVYHDSGEVDQSKIQSDSRLFGRSVWNNRWLLVIPGAALLADSEEGIQRLINGKPVPGQTNQRDGNGISDIKLIFKTYAYSGN